MNTATPSLKQAALGDLKHELATTRRVLERVPDEHLGWKPHPRSMSLGELATHLANLLMWQVSVASQDELDLATTPHVVEPAASREELLARFDAEAARLHAAMEDVSDADLSRTWSLRRGDQVLMSQPKLMMLRAMGISHIVHHRGQLSVYLRLLDVPVPSIYGPSADEARG